MQREAKNEKLLAKNAVVWKAPAIVKGGKAWLGGKSLKRDQNKGIAKSWRKLLVNTEEERDLLRKLVTIHAVSSYIRSRT